MGFKTPIKHKLLVSIQEFAAIQGLAMICEASRLSPDAPWPEDQWRTGLIDILGPDRGIFHEDFREWLIEVRHTSNPTLFANK